MELDLISISLLIICAGIGGVAGYWGRIVQKFEDRRDQIYLTDLPAIFSNMSAFKDSLTLYQNGSSIDYLETSLSKTSENLTSTVFSGDILIFEDELREGLLKFHHDALVLKVIITQIQSIEDSTKKTDAHNSLRLALLNKTNFLIENLEINPKQVLDQATKISEEVKDRLNGYHSYSWKLTAMIFILGGLIALIEVIKTFLSE
jgi:hypothetical protein